MPHEQDRTIVPVLRTAYDPLVATSASLRAICATVLVLNATAAQAQPVSPADDAFQRGREALKVGQYVEACAAFEESQRLDPQLATMFNIALCAEQLGKLASALAIYKELAAKDDNPPRKTKAIEMIPQLESRVARLRIELSENPAGLEVTVNGVRATNFRDMPIDLGASKVIARAPGYAEWTGEVTAKAEKESVVVTVKLAKDPSSLRPDLPPPPSPPSSPPESPRSLRRTLGLAGVIGGGVIVAGGLTVGVLARSKWNEAKDICGGARCTSQADLDRAQPIVDDARLRGTISTALVVGGAALVATGVVLWVTAPAAERSVAVTPTASPTGGGVAIVGAF